MKVLLHVLLCFGNFNIHCFRNGSRDNFGGNYCLGKGFIMYKFCLCFKLCKMMLFVALHGWQEKSLT